MPVPANPFANRTKHALGGAAVGMAIGLGAALLVGLVGGIRTPAEGGMILGLSLVAGLVIGWLAG
jgi:hypothetical protein